MFVSYMRNLQIARGTRLVVAQEAKQQFNTSPQDEIRQGEARQGKKKGEGKQQCASQLHGLHVGLGAAVACGMAQQHVDADADNRQQ